MPTRSSIDQIAFRYRLADSATGITRDTVRRLKKRAPQGKKKSVRSSLFEVEPA